MLRTFALVILILTCAQAFAVQAIPQLVNGSTVRNHYYPAFASFTRITNITNDRIDFVSCGAAFIAPHWALTAAHCVLNQDGTNTLQPVSQMQLTPAPTSEQEPPSPINANAIPVQNVFLPELTDVSQAPFSGHRNDIALLQLATPYQGDTLDLPTQSQIQRLQDLTRSANNQALRVIGWGETQAESLSSIPEQLQVIDLNIVPLVENCHFQGITTKTQWFICGKDFNPAAPANYQSTCQGDSGGPVMLQMGGTRYLVGIVSAGSASCGSDGMGALFTNVAYYRHWITHVINVHSTKGAVQLTAQLQVNALPGHFFDLHQPAPLQITITNQSSTVAHQVGFVLHSAAPATAGMSTGVTCTTNAERTRLQCHSKRVIAPGESTTFNLTVTPYLGNTPNDPTNQLMDVRVTPLAAEINLTQTGNALQTLRFGQSSPFVAQLSIARANVYQGSSDGLLHLANQSSRNVELVQIKAHAPSSLRFGGYPCSTQTCSVSGISSGQHRRIAISNGALYAIAPTSLTLQPSRFSFVIDDGERGGEIPLNVAFLAGHFLLEKTSSNTASNQLTPDYNTSSTATQESIQYASEHEASAGGISPFCLSVLFLIGLFRLKRPRRNAI